MPGQSFPFRTACFALAVLLWQLGGVVLQAQVLRMAREVRSLNAEEAQQGRPAELDVNVVFVESPGTVFVQDDSGATFLRTKSPLPALKPGDRVKATGTTFPGLYLPGVEINQIEVLGPGTLRPPPVATYDDLIAARHHYAEVVVNGVGRRVEPFGETKSLLKLSMGRQLLEVRIDAPPSDAPEGLIDAELRITGLAAGAINDRRQLVLPYLRVRDWAQIQISSPAPSAAEIPLTDADKLMAFGMASESARRVRLFGTVLAVFPPSRLFVRSPASDDEEDERPPLAFAVYSTHGLEGFEPGQSISVIGFPVMDRYSAALADAQVEHVEGFPSSTTSQPVDISTRQLLSGAHDGDLVRLTGNLQAAFQSADHAELVLRADAGEFRAQLPPGGPLPQLGARLAVTGICEIDNLSSDQGFRSMPTSARVLLRSPADMTVLNPAPWWTTGRLLAALGMATTLLVLAGAWIALLQRQVGRQTNLLRHRIAHEAALEERQRIAREFHDTLEQELAGLSLRLDAATTRPLEEKALSLLQTSRHLVSRIQSEARNLVADLRADPSAATDLASTLRELADRIPLHDLLSVQVQVQEPVPELPAHLVHHLRMIAQEAVTNAMKHAQARHIILRLAVAGRHLQMQISDDGRGMSTEAETNGKAGHFGCMGIRERCRNIGAEVTWRSASGEGTTVDVTLPLSNL